MNSPRGLLLSFLLVSSVWLRPVQARIQEHEMEQERLSGYKEYVDENQIFDRERLRSYRAYLESVEKDLFEKSKSLRDFRKTKKIEKQESDEIDNYKEFLSEQLKQDKADNVAMQEYRKNQRKSKAIQDKRDFTEEEELGIFVERPRYDYKKRALYGAKPKYKIATKPGSGAGGGGASSPSPDFATDSGYIPPPPPPLPAELPNEPFYDEIPPPPPPPFPADFGNGGGEMGDGYIPPPPPPPPMFDGEF